MEHTNLIRGGLAATEIQRVERPLSCLEFGPGLDCLRAVATVVLVLVMPATSIVYGQQIVFPGNEWHVATPEAMLMDAARIQQAVDYLAANSPPDGPGVSEMVIIRNGRVIWQGTEPGQTELVYSVTKSFATTVLGLLIDDGVVTLDTLASVYVPDMSELYSDVTLRHLATHTSGYLTRDEIFPLTYTTPIPENSFDPVEPLFAPPGSYFAYSGVSGMDQMMNVLTRAAGEEMQQLFQNRIGDSIDMDPDAWDWEDYQTSDGVVVDGGGIGLRISANDAARLGHLFLNNGNWAGDQLLSGDWVRKATSVQVPNNTPRFPSGESAVQYGYGWWIEPYGFSALGAYNNYIAVDPSLDLVVARMGRSSDWIPFDSFMSLLRTAAIPAVWDEQGDSHWDEFDPDTGKPRWRTESGMTPDIYPTNRAIVRTDTVTVAIDLPIDRLDIESGRVCVAEAGTLRSGTRIVVDPGAGFCLDGRGDANVVSVYGELDVSSTGKLEARALTLYEQGQMTVHGTIQLDRYSLRGGQAQLLAGGEFETDRFSQTGGRFVLNGDLSVGDLQVTDGLVEIHDSQTPVAVTERFRLVGQSELQMVISDESWDSPISLTEGIVPEFSGDLVLDFAATVNPKNLEGKTLNFFDWSEDVQPSSEFDRVISPVRIELDASRLYSAGEVVVQSVLDKPTLDGDFDGNGVLDANDIDAISARIRVGSTDFYYDVNGDQNIDQEDRRFWVEGMKNTWFGDSNLDGEFNSSDMVQVFVTGKYERDEFAGWEQGDWDGSARFDSSDMVTAFVDGGYEKGPRPDAAAVPEPGGWILLFLGLLPALFDRVRSRNWDEARVR